MDLNIIVYQDGTYSDEVLIQKRLKQVYNDCFTTVALTTIIEGEQIKNVPKPLKIVVPNNKLKVLNRLTVKVTNSMQVFNLNKNENFKLYDLFAVEPMNEQTLNQLNSGDIQCDIITFSSSDLHRSLRTANFSIPIERQTGIEINYGGLLSSSSLRRNTIAFGQLLVDKTRSKKIILSSGTRPEMTSRTPEDVACLAFLFGLPPNKAKNAIYVTPNEIIKRSHLRRNIVTSVIQSEEIDEKNETKCNDKRKSQFVENNIPNKKLKS